MTSILTLRPEAFEHGLLPIHQLFPRVDSVSAVEVRPASLHTLTRHCEAFSDSFSLAANGRVAGQADSDSQDSGKLPGGTRGSCNYIAGCAHLAITLVLEGGPRGGDGGRCVPAPRVPDLAVLQ
eukprot:7862062-Pyramimonas_sp.AAC.2